MKLKFFLFTIFVILPLVVSACQAQPHPPPASVATITSIALPQPAVQASPTTPASRTSRIPPTLHTLPPLPSATFSLTPAPSRTPAPVDLSHSQVVPFVKSLPDPDDLALGPDGAIYISDVGDGTIRRFTPDGRLQTLAVGLKAPEGMVILPDGTLVIAEQGKNRLVRLDLNTQTVSPFIDLKNTTGQDGVDGIALDNHDPANPSLIIPDSPNGTVLRASLDGRDVQSIASGFTRPTAAWVEPDGSVLVADEYGHALVRLRAGGGRETLARNLATPDDVVEDRYGRIFVNTLGDGAIHVISPDGKQDTTWIQGLSSPQGEILDRNGNLIVTDPGNHQVVKVVNH